MTRARLVLLVVWTIALVICVNVLFARLGDPEAMWLVGSLHSIDRFVSWWTLPLLLLAFVLGRFARAR